MPQLQTLTVNDRAATPVAHTFTPNQKDLATGVTRLVETGSVPIGGRSFTISLRQTGTKYRGRLVLTNPVVVNETINGVIVPKVARTAYATLDLSFDSTSSAQERKDTIGMIADALSATKVMTMSSFVDLEGIW